MMLSLVRDENTHRQKEVKDNDERKNDFINGCTIHQR